MFRPLAIAAILLIVGSLLPAAAPSTSHGAGHSLLWIPSTPEQAGIDSRDLLRVLERVRDDRIDLHALILLREGRVVLECYVHPYDQDALHNVKSVSKSVTAAMAGIALQRGILGGLDQRVQEFFPQHFRANVDPRKRQITLRHLLTMTSGLDVEENGRSMIRILGSRDWIGATLDRPMLDAPGERFTYSSFMSHTVSAMLTEASGRSLLDLSLQYLFGPLGITNVYWAVDPQGYQMGGAELFLRPRDMAKIGLLFANSGRWLGEQVVPEEWVAESTRNQLAGLEAEGAYGYGWWPDGSGTYRALGSGGQVIHVDPRSGLVAVLTSGDPDGARKLLDTLTAGVPVGETLPPNPGAVRALYGVIDDLGHPAPRPATAGRRSRLAREVSGRRYVFEGGERSVKALTLFFRDPRSARLLLENQAGIQRLEVGLDGVYRVTDTGAFGQRPRGNRFALRGTWIDDRTFAVDSHEIGSTLHARMVLRFEGETVRMESTARPVGARSVSIGRRQPVGALGSTRR